MIEEIHRGETMLISITGQAYQRKAHGGYDKITAYGWWSWNCPAGAHIKITGYNRTS